VASLRDAQAEHMPSATCLRQEPEVREDFGLSFSEPLSEFADKSAFDD
jgi:hypothetical protein